MLIILLLLLPIYTHAQCNYKWTSWSSSTGQNAQGTIQLKNHTVGVDMTTNYNSLDLSTNLYNHANFFFFLEGTPDAPVPITTWAPNGTTTVCFSELTHNPVLLLSSLGEANNPVTLSFSQPFTIVQDAGGINYIDNTGVTGSDGYTIILFPGDHTCINITSSNTDYNTHLNWAINEPAFDLSITETARDCRSVTLTANASEGVFFNWNAGTSAFTPENTFFQSAVFIVLVKNAAGCMVARSHYTNIVNTPIYKDTSVTICANQSYNGHSATGTYEDKFTSREGCDSITRLKLAVLPTIYTDIQQSICTGTSYHGHSSSGDYTETFTAYSGCDSIRNLHLTVLQPGIANITQSICEGDNFEGYLEPGLYTDILTAHNGCDSIRTIQLSVNPLPKPQLGPDKTLCTGDSLLLSPGSFDSYLWQDGSTSPQYKAMQPGHYAVLVTNPCGALQDDIVLRESNCTPFFPTAFSPNGDGLNDLFKIRNAYNIDHFSLAIFSRWGQKLFETKDYTQGWNGRINGQSPIIGTYIWQCNCSINGINRSLKGVISLVQ